MAAYLSKPLSNFSNKFPSEYSFIFILIISRFDNSFAVFYLSVFCERMSLDKVALFAFF